jgi:hypothetical protein
MTISPGTQGELPQPAENGILREALGIDNPPREGQNEDTGDAPSERFAKHK